ncbi:hypothetical protein GGR21_004192 [Dysgonomonas hofstadii]|uniref:Uncharacterized protein n=1 Tax=Dysgonomonas hofstadii TaxID=637886 RepID=A0A840CQH4_9BACT|nr:hypothetical protein [Dysgonomonas hofstadii]MBB4038260.1 hypothetical protein [Dysgonomonas hofstadii]
MTKYEKIIGFLTSSFVILFTLYCFKQGNAQRAHYPVLTKNFYISGTVIEKRGVGFSFNRGTLIGISDGNRFNPDRIINESDDKSYFDEFIQIGDSIYKKKDSDTIYVLRDKNRFYFIMD